MITSKEGKKNKMAGMRFELKVRKDLESKGWIVDKWTNNVELEEAENDNWVGDIRGGKLHPAKSNRFRQRSTGFPDFIAFRDSGVCVEDDGTETREYEVIAVESKMNGKLSKVEKEKCSWYLDNNIFGGIWIAKQGEKRGQIVYEEFK